MDKEPLRLYVFLYRKIFKSMYDTRMYCSKTISSHICEFTSKLRKTIHLKKERFRNIYEPLIEDQKSLVKARDFSTWVISLVKQSFLEKFVLKHTLESRNLKQILHQFNSNVVNLNKPIAKWLGHSSVFVSAFGVNLITDPVFADRIGCSFFSLNRKSEHTICVESMEKADAVLISHNHFDHYDEQSIDRIVDKNPKLIFFIPKGFKLRDKFKKCKMFEIDWWGCEEVTINNVSLRIHSVPAIHHSRSGIFDKNVSKWCGWICEFLGSSKKVFYFAGDTAFNKNLFSKIGKKFGEIDLSFIPVGAYFPRSLLSPVHIDPHDAALVHKLVCSKISVGCHHSTFRLSSPFENTRFINDFKQAVKAYNIVDKFLLIPIGCFLNW